MIKLYNTLTKQLEEFKPQHADHVNMYSCGPTVYNTAHIGNLRSFIAADLLYCALTYDGQMVNWTMNITDIDDKTINGAIEKYGSKATVEDLRRYTEGYFEQFKKDLEAVNVSVKDINFIRVTDVIPQIQNFIMELVHQGLAYTAEDGSTYFSISKYQDKFHDYGSLVGKDFLEGKKTGARVKVDEYDKDNLSDFALWKAFDEKDAQIFWEHEVLGKGRPGWHIECSVINFLAFAAEPTDIHTGGVDLIFPHHTNEIAQSQPLYTPFVCHWLHSEHLLVDGKKMAKSLKNFYTLDDKIFSLPHGALDLRYLFMQSMYSAQLNFTKDSLMAAHQALEGLYAASERLDGSGSLDKSYEGKFFEAMSENLNIPKALAVAWEIIGDKNLPIHEKKATLLKFDEVFGLNLANPPRSADAEIPDEVKKLLEQRVDAREQKDFAKSDELRKKIEALGYEAMDTPEGQKVRKITRMY